LSGILTMLRHIFFAFSFLFSQFIFYGDLLGFERVFGQFVLNDFYYEDEIIADVDGKPITRSFVKAVKDVFEIKSDKEAIDFIVDSYVILGYAKKKNIYVDDKEVDFIIEKTFGKSIKDVERDIIKKGLFISELKDFVRAKRISEIIFYQLTGGSFLTEKELKDFYEKNKERIEELFEMRFVLFYESDEVFKNASTGILDTCDVSGFDEMGWVRRGELEKRFNDAIFSHSTTGCVFISSYEDGKSVIFFIKAIKKPNFEELKDNLDFRNFYIKEKYKEVFERWLGVQRKKSSIRIRENLLGPAEGEEYRK